MEAGLKRCCKGGTEVLECSDSKWREVMDGFCVQELSVKTSRHPCCAETGDPRYLCFAGDAPYPKYDREITNISLARLTLRAMQALCAPHRLLTRRFSVPLLVGRLKEQCCGVAEMERVRCAEREKEAMCLTDHGSDKNKHPFCIHSNKLQAVPIATAVATEARKCPLF
ncbi:extracellular matrix protein 1-like [Polyodon spathula]|uniref:extracellular matrix protein 1-like n=1 Tax=Polyodon spathula TaxID=7913 RepID=UPI001B7F2B52|nr:extracellular matrix protein 1-like [Polyodon spathula]